MKFLTLALTNLLLITFSINLISQEETNPYGDLEKEAISIVNSQLEAYNDQNLDKFMSFFHDSIQVFQFPDIPMASGQSELDMMYRDFFKSAPNLNCEILNRIVSGNTVIDQELVTGFSEDAKAEMRATAIYTIKDGLIYRLYFIMN